MGRGGGGSSSAMYAAQQEAKQSKENLAMQTWANRPEMETPWGSQTWESSKAIDPATGLPVTQWKSSINLTPDQQAALDSQQRIQQGRSDAAETLLGQATGAFQTPFDWGALPTVPGSVDEAQKNAFGTLSASLEPGRARERARLETKLLNMGAMRGGEAFRNAMSDQAEQFAGQDRNLLAQAMSEGRSDVATQQGLRGAAIDEQVKRRGMTLNELNALLTGQQVQMPGMPQFAPAGVAQAADLTGAQARGAQQDAAGGVDAGSAIGAVGGIALAVL